MLVIKFDEKFWFWKESTFFVSHGSADGKEEEASTKMIFKVA